MLRTRDFLTVTLPAALLALAVQPLLDAPAPAQATPSMKQDRIVPASAEAPAGTVSVRLDAASGTSVVVRQAGPSPAVNEASDTRRAIQTPPPPAPTVRPRMRVGCEGAISALAGQEARRLLPSRCLA